MNLHLAVKDLHLMNLDLFSTLHSSFFSLHYLHLWFLGKVHNLEDSHKS